MPYAFADTVPQEATAEEMPAEALKLNGEYIENLIDARYGVYRTLYVRGRESLLAEIEAFETGVRDGSSILSKRFPAREIVIGYKLQAAGNAYFRFAYNQLASILNVQDAELIFYDEQDKYFIGTPQGLDEVEPGRNFVQGEIIILCADPFKYSVKEYEVEPTEDNGSTFVIDYNGTHKTFPTLEANFKGDCGFVAWFNQNSKVIQLGDSEEEDEEQYKKSETLFSQNFNDDTSTSSWTYNFTYNNRPVWIVPSGSSYGLSGGTSFNTLNGNRYITAGSFMDSPGGWTGTSISRAISATQWTVSWSQVLSVGTGGSANETRGGIEVMVIDSSGNTIAAVTMYKGSGDSGSTGHIGLFTYGQSTIKDNIDFSRSNSRWGTKGSCSMVKSGGTVSWNLGGTSYSLTDSAISNMQAARVVIVFLKLSEYGTLQQGIYSFTAKKDNVTAWRDIPNKFGNGDVATAECESGTVKMNGSEAPEYGAIGNQWEEFYLEPGYNQIGLSYSDWCTSKPSSTLRYREVYI